MPRYLLSNGYSTEEKETNTLAKSRVTGRLVEKCVAGINYSYAGPGNHNSWIDGHEYANPAEILGRLSGSKTQHATRSWIVAQLYWWGVFPSSLRIPASIKKCDLAATLEGRMMEGGLIAIHPKDVWAPLEKEWEEKFGSLATRPEDGDSGDAADVESSYIKPTADKRKLVDQESDKGNPAPASRKRPRVTAQNTLLGIREPEHHDAPQDVEWIAWRNSKRIEELEREHAELGAELCRVNEAVYKQHLEYANDGLRRIIKTQKELAEVRRRKTAQRSIRAEPRRTEVRWYGIQGGRNPGVYNDYADVATLVKCYGGRQQRFACRADAEAFAHG